jgi:hypothetical protein
MIKIDMEKLFTASGVPIAIISLGSTKPLIIAFLMLIAMPIIRIHWDGLFRKILIR